MAFLAESMSEGVDFWTGAIRDNATGDWRSTAYAIIIGCLKRLYFSICFPLLASTGGKTRITSARYAPCFSLSLIEYYLCIRFVILNFPK